jgi:hypothetical protein
MFMFLAASMCALLFAVRTPAAVSGTRHTRWLSRRSNVAGPACAPPRTGQSVLSADCPQENNQRFDTDTPGTTTVRILCRSRGAAVSEWTPPTTTPCAGSSPCCWPGPRPTTLRCARRTARYRSCQRISTADRSCLNVTLGTYAGLSGARLVKPDYLSSPCLAASELSGVPLRPGSAVAREADTLVKPEYLTALTASLCAVGAQVNYRISPALAHGSLAEDTVGFDDGTVPDIITCLADRRVRGRISTHVVRL